MNEFLFYIKQGIQHISDFAGFDHMLFIIVLSSNYTFKNWKKVVVLVTAFTIGHSATLALTSLGLLQVNFRLIEFIIPITILITSVYRLSIGRNEKTMWIPYTFALMFGLIHGMGFSNFFQSMTMGIDDEILFPLFSFNVGIEIGQLAIVLVTLITQLIVISIFKFIKQKQWYVALNLLGTCLSIYLISKIAL